MDDLRVGPNCINMPMIVLTLAIHKLRFVFS